MAAKGLIRLYVTRGSPPSTAVLATCDALEISFEKIEMNFMAGEHLSAEHEKRNPQRELPVLEDNGFFLSESVAIMQYLCDKYGAGESLYPHDHKNRAIINHRLLFNLSSFYPAVADHTFGAIFGLNEDPEKLRSKCLKVLSIFETILQRQGTRFVAGESFSIADIAVSGALVCLDAVDFDLTPYPNIATWYNEIFKNENSWKIMKTCRDDLNHFYKNPPTMQDLQKLKILKDKKLI